MCVYVCGCFDSHCAGNSGKNICLKGELDSYFSNFTGISFSFKLKGHVQWPSVSVDVPFRARLSFSVLFFFCGLMNCTKLLHSSLE